MRYYLFFSISLFCLNHIFGQSYSATSIPQKMTERANAVIRDEQYNVQMKAPDDVNISMHKVMTILNKSGDKYGKMVLFYNKSRSIDKLNATILDAEGKIIQKISQKQFADESAISSFSLYEDSRVKWFYPNVMQYPYTIVWDYTVKSKQNLIIDDWNVNEEKDVAVEQSQFQFTCNANDTIRIKENHMQQPGTEKIEKDKKTYIWTAQNVPARKDEPLSPPIDPFNISVRVSPVHFSYYKKNGTYHDWNELGKWVFNNLIQDRQTPTPSMIEEVATIKAKYSDTKDIVSALYTYLQGKTRYISVQIGIGGFQPMLASEVDRVGYGDCKALVNYMQALLHIAQIPSIYCIVEAGNKKVDMDPSFASMDQGNHIILCVPLAHDSLWMDCTAQHIPAGFLGDFTDDRLVWACTADSGWLLRTPVYPTKDNKCKNIGHFTLDQNGDVEGSLHASFTGTQYDTHIELLSLSESEKIKKLTEYYDVDNIEFSHAELLQSKIPQPEMQENLQISLRHYAAKDGQNRYYLHPNLFVRTSVPNMVRNRQEPLYLNRGYVEEDSIIWQIPEKMHVIVPIVNKEIQSEFGSFRIKAIAENNKLIFYRKLIRNNGSFAADKYDKYVSFMSDVQSYDKVSLVLSQE